MFMILHSIDEMERNALFDWQPFTLGNVGNGTRLLTHLGRRQTHQLTFKEKCISVNTSLRDLELDKEGVSALT